MSATPSGVVGAMVSLLGTVSSVGVVHPYRRVIRTVPQITALLTDPATGKLNAAYVSLQSMSATKDFGGAGFAGVLTTFVVRVELIRGVEDASGSEEVFRTTVFDVMQAVNAGGKFYAAASYQGAMSATELGYLSFADAVLVHYATLAVEVRGRTAP